jgi:hypothetical protein
MATTDDICAQLGVPPKDWHLFRRWAAESVNTKASDELRAYVDVMIASRCRTPGSDLLSKLIEDGIDGEDLTVDEVHAAVAAMLTGTPRRGPPREQTQSDPTRREKGTLCVCSRRGGVTRYRP